MAGESYASFDQVKARLDEIVDAVGSSEMPLDEALSLYEEAVGLGLRASELLEENIEARDRRGRGGRRGGRDRPRGRGGSRG
ncbi:MAG TPA: exodeoxyribonuclease VII small subunit [Eggerthellaceae bacterium]|nr:exodeoxyribonuclease VII small subunit [Eggerthellaceae bacterium]